MLFVKYLSDVHDDKMDAYLQKYSGDLERAKRAMKHERFVVPEQSHFRYLFDNRNASNIGEMINIALTDLKKQIGRNCTAKMGQGFSKTLILITISWARKRTKIPV